MKKGLLYLLFFSYTLIVLKPVLPTVTDLMAHIFWYSKHVATVHYEHGKYHVHYEYQEAAKDNYPEKDASLPKSEVSASEHMIADNFYDFRLPAIIQTQTTAFSPDVPHIYLFTDFPPPKA